MKPISIKNWIVVFFGLLAPAALSFWGYATGAFVVSPAMAAAQVIFLQVERLILGPLFFGYPIFVYAGIAVLLYLVFLAFEFRNSPVKFPIIFLAEGAFASVAMFLMFGFLVIWVIPALILVYILGFAFWYEQIRLSERAREK